MNMFIRWRRNATLLTVIGTIFLAGVIASEAGAEGMVLLGAPSSSPLVVGTLNVRGTVRLVSTPAECPPEAPSDVRCRARIGKGALSGLGGVSVTYSWFHRMGPPTCPADVGKPLATTGRLIVAGRGEIGFALADGTRCIEEEPLRNEPQDFTITGGTGTYAGASGRGTLDRSISILGLGTDTWTGTLIVPGHEFDVTPPVLSGATSKAVRAPKGVRRVRVIYTVTANDAVDDSVPVICVPRSASRFPIGRTTVTCTATDSSANTASASFRVTVRAPS